MAERRKRKTSKARESSAKSTGSSVRASKSISSRTPRTTSRNSDNTNTWAMLCHISALLGFIGIPLGNIIGPLILWLIKKNEMPFVNEQGKEALNFQISILIYAIISAIFTIILIGFLFLAIVLVFDLVMIIVAAVRSSNGENFRYPFSIRFIR